MARYGRTIDRIVNVIVWIAIAAMFISLIIAWKGMPDQIPTHYNSAGEITAWGKKATALVIPIMAFMVCGLITLFEFLPRAWNIPTKITEENMDHVYRQSRNLITTAKLLVVIMCGYMHYTTLRCQPMSRYFLPIVLVLMVGTPIFFIIRMIIRK